MPNPSLLDALSQTQPPQAPPAAAAATDAATPPPAPPSVPEHQLRAPLTRGEFFAGTPHPFLAKLADISTGPGAQFLLSTAGAVLGSAINPLLGAGLAAAGVAVPPAMRMLLANRGLIPPPAPGETEPEITPRGIAQEAMVAGMLGGIPVGHAKTAQLMEAFDRTAASIAKKPLSQLLRPKKAATAAASELDEELVKQELPIAVFERQVPTKKGIRKEAQAWLLEDGKLPPGAPDEFVTRPRTHKLSFAAIPRHRVYFTNREELQNLDAKGVESWLTKLKSEGYLAVAHPEGKVSLLSSDIPLINLTTAEGLEKYIRSGRPWQIVTWANPGGVLTDDANTYRMWSLRARLHRDRYLPIEVRGEAPTPEDRGPAFFVPWMSTAEGRRLAARGGQNWHLAYDSAWQDLRSVVDPDTGLPGVKSANVYPRYGAYGAEAESEAYKTVFQVRDKDGSIKRFPINLYIDFGSVLDFVEPETRRALSRKHVLAVDRFFQNILKASPTEESRLVTPEEIIAVGAAGGAAPWYHESRAVLEPLLGKEDYRRWAAMHAALSPRMTVPTAMAVAFDLLTEYSRNRRTMPVLDALRFAISEVMGKPGQTGMTTHVPNLVRGMLELEEQLQKSELVARLWFSGNKVRDFYPSLLAEGPGAIDTLMEKALFLSPELLQQQPLAQMAVSVGGVELTTPGYIAARGVVAEAAQKVRDLDVMKEAARQMLTRHSDAFKSEYLKGLEQLLQSAVTRAPEHGLTPMEGQAAIWAVFRLINELGVVHMAKTIKAAEAAGKRLTKQQFKELIPTAITDNVLEEMQKPGVFKDVYSDVVTLITKDRNVREAFQRFLKSERASTKEQLVSAIERASQIVEDRVAASRIPTELLTPGFRRYVTNLLERAAESGEFTVSKNIGARQTVRSFLQRKSPATQGT